MREDTTKCNGTFTEPNVSTTGIHRISVSAEGQNGGIGSGTRAVNVIVAR
jgi:hypothetical protein